MNSKELIEFIKQDIIEVKKQGQEAIAVENLIKYLGDLKKQVNKSVKTEKEKIEIDITLARLAHERNLAGYNAQVQNNIEMLRSVMMYGSEALKSAILINGGAAVALLAFIGNIWTRGIVPTAVIPLTNALYYFTEGTVSAAVGVGLTYFTQYFYSIDKNKVGAVFHGLSIATVVLAYIFFYQGATSGHDAFLNHFGIR